MEKTILIVDAMTETSLYLKSSLVKKGYKCLTSSSAVDAMNKLKQHPEVGLILTDISLPDMRTKEFIEKVKSPPLRSNAQICFLVGKHRTNESLNSLSSVEGDFITKPVEAEKLRSKVEELIGKPPVIPNKKFIVNAPVFMVDSPIQPDLILASVSSDFMEIRATARLQPLFVFKIRCDQLGQLLGVDNHFLVKVSSSEKQRSGLWLSKCELQGQKIVVSPDGFLTKSAS